MIDQSVYQLKDELSYRSEYNNKSFTQLKYNGIQANNQHSPQGSPKVLHFQEKEIIQNELIIQRSTINEDQQNENNHNNMIKSHVIYLDKHSPKSQHQSSIKNSSCQNSFRSQSNLNNDQRFLQILLKTDRIKIKKWYYPLIVFFKFVFIQLLNPFLCIYSLFSKKKRDLIQNRSLKNRIHIFLLEVYFSFTSVILWMTIINFIYLKFAIPLENDDQDYLISEYNRVFLYYLVVSIGVSIIDTAAFKNSSTFFLLFNSISKYSSRNLPRFMKDLFISDHDFIFQFINFPNEDEQKLKQKNKIKKIYRVNDQNNPYFASNRAQYYSGLDFCEKIIHYSEQRNVKKNGIIIRQFILTIIVFIKAFIPGIYRRFTNQEFIIYSPYFTIVPYICVGNIVGLFSRALNSLQDLNFIYDYNRALSALITYDSYLKLKPKYVINTPSINCIDIKSLKTWSQMRKLLNELKKEETLPIDKCTLFMFIYLALILLAVFLDKFFHSLIMFSFSSQKFLLPYYSIDILLISGLFCYRVFKQTQINQQYREQQKLLQNVKNILIKFFIHQEIFVEKDNIILLDKDIQWYFYAILHDNYINSVKSKYEIDIIQTEKIKDQLQNMNKSNQMNKINHRQPKASNSSSKFDFEYQTQLINLIEFIQTEIQMEILQTPMKFMGLLPSSYALLWTFLSFVVTFIYLSFYLYFYDVK